MRIARRHWLWALAAATAAHAGLLVFFYVPPPSNADTSAGGIEISLASTGGAPGAVSEATAVAQAEPVAAATAAPVAPQVEAAIPVVEPATAASEPTPPPEIASPVKPEAAVETVPVVEEVKTAEPVPLPPAPPQRPRPPAAQPAAPPAPAPSIDPPSEQVAVATPNAGSGGTSSGEARPDSAPGANVASAGRPGVANYMSKLSAWLEKHKEYPYAARRRRQQGTALLYFEMDRNGRVTSFRLEESSGFPALDREVLALIERAQPLPPIPPEMTDEHIKLVVPVEFFLR